ncbi:MAG: D-alanyl-D-alanine carboxypeptidase family protein [Hyphomicrobiaceae bacterium]
MTIKALCRHMALATMPILVALGHVAAANPLLLFEPATGRVLYAEEPDRAWHPASVTKLMTAYLTFEAVKVGRLAWDDDVPLSEHARSQPATRIGLRGGIKLNVEQAVRGLILRSANDFAVALAERVGGTEAAFVELMNATAKRLGMSRTVYRNPHGLPDAEQVTTARDLAVLTTALLRDFPDRAEVFSTPTVHIHKGTFHSQNDLLRTLPGADGMKTGFTCASGYNVVASATRDGRRLVAIVLGAVNRQKRSERATELIEAGFDYVSSPRTADETVSIPPEKPIKVRGKAKDEQPPAPKAFSPIGLGRMAISPAEPVPPQDIAHDLRSRKCRGYSGFPKHEPETEIETSEAGDTEKPVGTATVVTGSVASTAVKANAAIAAKTSAKIQPHNPVRAKPRRKKSTSASRHTGLVTRSKTSGTLGSGSKAARLPPAPATGTLSANGLSSTGN